ncbi:YveK family protein, partial [Romboutsia sp.]|uniref:YveK family protein n=1 Tax=Romboutsia sp. TaxID=1965302 RepID=UPI002D17F68A
TTLIVNTDQDENTKRITDDQYRVTEKLAVMYGEIIKSRIVLEPVIDNLKLDETFEQLSEQITVSPVKDTQIISISVQDTNPNKARDIANEITKVFPKEAKRITKANGVEVIDKAIVPNSPIKPNKVMNVAIAAVLGIMIGLFVVFLIEYLDNKIKTPQDIEKYLGLPILGVIPNEKLAK